MKAVVLHSPGSVDNFQIEEHALPIPKSGEVLVKIMAFGVNRSELMTRKGLSPAVKFPKVLGIECVGIIETDHGGEYEQGQKVAAFMGGMGREFDGSYSEYVVVPQNILMPFDSDLPWEIIGALPEMFQTAYGSLHKALSIKKDETLLIRGGTSSVGLLAIQLAAHHGCRVIATTRNSENREFLINHGAHKVLIDDGNLASQIKQNDEGKVHKLLELVGAQTLPDSLQCVREGGIVCMTGMLSEKWSIAEFAPMDVIPALVQLTIYDSGQIRVSSESFQKFLNLIEKGLIRPNISKTFQFPNIPQAHHYMESNRSLGKIVIAL